MSFRVETSSRGWGIGALLLLFVMAIFGLTILLGSWYTVDQGDRGVILRNGALVGEAEPGLGFKLPLIDSVTDVSMRSQTFRYEGVEAYSSDQQTGTIGLSITLRVTSASELYSRFRETKSMVDSVVYAKMAEQLKNVFGRFNAATTIQERPRLNSEVAGAITRSVSDLRLPIIIEAVQIEDISFDDTYEAAIRERMKAEVEVLKLRQNAEREKVQAQIVVTQAQAQADSTVARAKANAESITLQGEAEATAIRARAAALADNPLLVQLTQAERWDGKLPGTMIPGGTVPMLSLGR